MSNLYTRTETVEAHQWNPADPLTAGHTLGWLLAKEVEFTHTSGPEGRLTLTLDPEALTVHPGQWIVHHPEHGHSVVDPDDFEATYTPAETDRTRRHGVSNVINGASSGTVIQTGDHHGDIRL